MRWYDAKGWLSDTLAVTKDQIHVHVGLAIFLAVAVILHKRRAAPLLAWLSVAFMQIANEVLDARDWYRWTGTVNWGEALKDTVDTLFWPTVIVLVWRFLGRPGRSR